MDAFLLFLFLAAFAAAPCLAWNVTRRWWLTLFGIFALFGAIQWPALTGAAGASHDALWSYSHFWALLRQWMDSGQAIGWNPYLQGGQPLYIFNNHFNSIYFWTAHFISKILQLEISPYVFSSIVYIFIHLVFVSGTFLLLMSLRIPPLASVMGMMSLLFGGFFAAELVSPVVLFALASVPIVLFLILWGWRNGDSTPIALSLPILGVSAGVYLPVYFGLVLAVALLCLLIPATSRQARYFTQQAKLLGASFRRQWLTTAAGLIAFVAVVSPMLLVLTELRDYVSPTRGFGEALSMSDPTAGYQPPAGIRLHEYLNLLDRWATIDPVIASGPQYVGILPLLGLGVALTTSTGRRLALGALLLAWLSLGHAGGLWTLIRKIVPMVDMARHTYAFARPACFLLVLAAACFPVDRTTVGTAWRFTGLVAGSLVTTAAGFAIHADGIFFTLLLIEATVLAVILFVPDSLLPAWRQWRTLMLVILLSLHVLDVSGVANRYSREASAISLPTLQPISYPESWSAVNPETTLPFDLKGLRDKKAIWFAADANRMFLLRRRFAEQVAPIFLCGTQSFCRNAAGPIVTLLPSDLDPLDWLASSRLSLDKPVKQPRLEPAPATLSASSTLPGHPAAAAGDGLGGTFWHISVPVTGKRHWINVDLHDERRVCAVEIVGRSDVRQLWRRSGATLLTRGKDGDWISERKLTLPRGAKDDAPNAVHRFVLQRCRHTSALRIEVDDPDFYSIAEISALATPRGGEWAIPVVDADPNRLRVVARLKQPGRIVRFENYHSGWSANLDGRELKIEEISGGFQSVALPPGEHELTFEFTTMYGKLVGLQIFIITACWLMMLGWLTKREYLHVK